MASRKKTPKAKPGQRSRDWKKARRLYERDGKNFKQIAGIIGCTAPTVSVHARREGWVDPQRVAIETAPERREKLRDHLVAAESELLFATIEEKKRRLARSAVLADVVFDLLQGSANGLKALGRPMVEKDEIHAIRQLALGLKNVDDTCQGLLKAADGLGSTDGRGGADSEAAADPVRTALDALEEGEP